VVAAHYKKKDDLLNCWASRSDISGYHADFHEGHGTVGACRGAAWARRAMCESTFILPPSSYLPPLQQPFIHINDGPDNLR